MSEKSSDNETYPEPEPGCTVGDEANHQTRLDETQRPPGFIDTYFRCNFFGLKGRITLAMMAMLGFFISFAARFMIVPQSVFEQIPDGLAMKAMADSLFFWGYAVSPIPGGFLASMVPAHRVFGLAICASVVLNMTIPGIMLLNNVTLLVIVRGMQGVFEGIAFPASLGIWRFWASPPDRTFLPTIAFCGSTAGTALGLATSLIDIDISRWQAPFYLYSVFGIIWYIAWLWLVVEKPRDHTTITAEERKFIEESFEPNTKYTMPTLSSIPFGEMVKSKLVWAITFVYFCRSWYYYLLELYDTTFLERRFKEHVGGTSTDLQIQFIATVAMLLGGSLCDTWRLSGKMTTSNVRKLFGCGGLGLEAIIFLYLPYCSDMFGAAVALMFGNVFRAFAVSGWYVNYLDIAPRYASILMGFSSGIGSSLAGILCPIAIDFLVQYNDEDNLQLVFILTASLYLVGAIFFGMFASGELQPWAEPLNHGNSIELQASPASQEERVSV